MVFSNVKFCSNGKILCTQIVSLTLRMNEPQDNDYAHMQTIVNQDYPPRIGDESFTGAPDNTEFLSV